MAPIMGGRDVLKYEAPWVTYIFSDKKIGQNYRYIVIQK